jgi:Co/Zn/Cd efflux system component
MDACCETKAEELTALRGEHKKVLTIVLVINAVLFIVEAAAGLLALSTALLADSLDMFGDSLVYGFSLYVLFFGAARSGRPELPFSKALSWRCLAPVC